MSQLKTAVIMAGGKGTRLAPITGVLPKPMANIRGTLEQNFGKAKDTILEHQMDMLSENGVTNFILVVGNKKGFIKSAFTNETINNNIPGRNITIRYFEEEEQTPLGTGGSFCSKDLQAMIGEDDFILTYADVLFDINIQDMYRFHQEENADATMIVGPCKAPDDRVLCQVGEDGKEIVGLMHKQGKDEGPRGCYFPNLARNGITIFSPSLFRTLPSVCTFMDMETDILNPMVYNPHFRVCAWKSPCYIKDIGTVDRFEEGVKELAAGIPAAKNPAKQDQACVIFKESDLFDEQHQLNAPIAGAISVLNDNGVIVGLQQDMPAIDNAPLGEQKVDTDLVRQADGAFVNFKFGEEDIETLMSVMREWNISPDQTYVIERFFDRDYLVSNFVDGDQSFELSPSAAVFAILNNVENLKAERDKEQYEDSMRGLESFDAEECEVSSEFLDRFSDQDAETSSTSVIDKIAQVHPELGAKLNPSVPETPAATASNPNTEQ